MPIAAEVITSAYSFVDVVDLLGWVTCDAPISRAAPANVIVSGQFKNDLVSANILGLGFIFGEVDGNAVLTDGTIEQVQFTTDGVLSVIARNVNVDFSELEPLIAADEAGTNTAAVETFFQTQTWDITLSGAADNGTSAATIGDGVPFNLKGNDTIDGAGGNDTLFSGDGDDKLLGGNGNDNLDGGAGNDFILGGNGSDTVTAGLGDDQVYAGAGDTGADSFTGGAGNDTMGGGAGNDSLYGQADDDVLFGGSGDDLLDGGNGADTAWSGSGADTVSGGYGSDIFGGGAGNDSLEGGSGNDTIYGAAGSDLVGGGSGNDEIFGGADNDTLTGGTGNDSLFGGNGNDLFIFEVGHGDDFIGGFASKGNNTIDLSALGLSGFNALTVSQAGSDAVINTGSGSLTLWATNISDISASDFVF